MRVYKGLGSIRLEGLGQALNSQPYRQLVDKLAPETPIRKHTYIVECPNHPQTLNPKP